MTRSRLWWIVGALLLCSAAGQAALVSHWRMGEDATFDGSNWTVPDQEASPANGVSSGLDSGAVVAGVEFVGETNNLAMQFNGSGYVSLGAPAKLDLTGSMSVCAWANPATGDGQQPIVGKGDTQYMLRWSSANEFEFFTQDGGGWHQVDSNPTAVPGEWYFVVAVVDSSLTNNQISIYVDGELQGQTSGGITTSSYDVEIGRNSQNTGRNNSGIIDDVRIYDHALTQAEILALYALRAAAPVVGDPVVDPSPYVMEGTDVTIACAVEGANPITNQWYHNGAPVAGGTNAVLDLPAAAVADSGDYFLIASNPFGAATSQVATLTVGATGTISFFDGPYGATRYTGGQAVFSSTVLGAEPLSLQWTFNGTPIGGATNDTVTVTGITTGDAGDYVLVATNDETTDSSAAATLTVLTPVADSYEEAVINAGPVAYWQMEEDTGDIAYDYMGGYDAMHNTSVVIDVIGPRPPEQPGMPTDNAAVAYDGATAGSDVGVSLMDDVTGFSICGWFRPDELPQDDGSTQRISLFGQNNLMEFGWFSPTSLGCWIDEAGLSVNFDPASRIEVGTWYFIACIADGSTAYLYLDSALVDSASISVTDFGSSAFPFKIGEGVIDDAGGFFNGAIDDVAVYHRALSALEISSIVSAAKPVPPYVTIEQTDTARYEGFPVTLRVEVQGALPIGYQWYKDGAPLSDGGNISGATTPAVSLGPMSGALVGSYYVEATNSLGSTTSTPAALSVRTPAPGSYEEAVVGLGPIAYWTLDELGGLVGYDYAGGHDTAHSDFTYVGNNGPQPPTYPGMASGNPGIAWDGFADDISRTPTSLMDGLAQFTIMGWMKLDQTGGLPALNEEGGERVALFGQNDAAEFGFHTASELGIWTEFGGYVTVNPSNVMSAAGGDWVFLVATGDGQALRLYADGVLVDTDYVTVSEYGNSGSTFTMGNGVLDGGGNAFWGSVDEVAMFDYAVSPSEVQTLYGLGAAVSFPVEILEDPTEVTLYAGSPAAADFSVLAGGTAPLGYAWRKDGVALSDGGSVSGSLTDWLSIFPVAALDQGDYDVMVSNAGSAATSSVARLTVIVQTTNSYEGAVLDLDPAGYWRLNEPTGSVVAIEAWNGRNGTYRSAAAPGEEGAPGIGFEPGNTGVLITADTDESDVALPSLGFNTNTVTITCWLKAIGDQGGFRGLVYLRGGGQTAGLHFGNGNELRYTWTGDQYWWFADGPVVPTNEWVFAALVVEPDQGTLYMGAGGLLEGVVNVGSHDSADFNNSPTYIGFDPNSTGRHFNGLMDEVMVIDRALSSEEIEALYYAGVGAPVLMGITLDAGGNPVVTWPEGSLFAAPEVTGTWSEVIGAMSPYTITSPAGPTEFYRAGE